MYACNCGQDFPNSVVRLAHADVCKVMKLEHTLAETTQKLETVSAALKMEQERAECLAKDVEAARDLWKSARQRADVADLQVEEARLLLAEFAARSYTCQHMFKAGSEHRVPDDCTFPVCKAATWLKRGVTEKRHGLAECQHDHRREDVFWNEAGSTKRVKCVDCGSQLS